MVVVSEIVVDPDPMGHYRGTVYPDNLRKILPEPCTVPAKAVFSPHTVNVGEPFGTVKSGAVAHAHIIPVPDSV